MDNPVTAKKDTVPMNHAQDAKTVPVPKSRNRDTSRQVKLYTSTIACLGLMVSLYALLHLPVNIKGMALFVVMAIILELASVELFRSSRSQVSMASVITIASIMALGPMAGVISHLASGRGILSKDE
jgi:hypothetical protein